MSKAKFTAGALVHCPCLRDGCKGTVSLRIAATYPKARQARAVGIGSCDRCGIRLNSVLVSYDLLTPFPGKLPT